MIGSGLAGHIFPVGAGGGAFLNVSAQDPEPVGEGNCISGGGPFENRPVKASEVGESVFYGNVLLEPGLLEVHDGAFRRRFARFDQNIFQIEVVVVDPDLVHAGDGSADVFGQRKSRRGGDLGAMLIAVLQEVERGRYLAGEVISPSQRAGSPGDPEGDRSARGQPPLAGMMSDPQFSTHLFVGKKCRAEERGEQPPMGVLSDNESALGP